VLRTGEWQPEGLGSGVWESSNVVVGGFAVDLCTRFARVRVCVASHKGLKKELVAGRQEGCKSK
jgi:hypothetical protein